jgi:hypothetical protein
MISHTNLNPALASKPPSDHIDYSEVYKTQENKQLNKRLKRVRNILLICAIAVLGGAVVFWVFSETSFTTSHFLVYSGLAGLLVLLSFFSNKKPYVCILAAILICIAFWTIEMVLNKTDDFLIEGSIQKLFIISLLVTSLHTSKEAELIRKELHFS